MKSNKKTLIATILLSLPVIAAHAGTATPANNASATVLSDGLETTVTRVSPIKAGDRITAKNGPVELKYGACHKILPKDYYIVIPSGKKCGVIRALNNTGTNISKAAASTTTHATAATAAGVLTAGKLITLGAVIVSAVIIADNHKSSPD